MNKVDLSIIILNYNTKKLTLDAVGSIANNYPDEIKSGEYEVIVADNASPDGSLIAFKDFEKHTKIKTFKIIDNKDNIGFAAGNNNAVKFSVGKYVLFLNPDTVVLPNTLNNIVEFMDTHSDAAAATCRIDLPSGGIDEASHRGFPTPWNAFTHFSGLEKVFSKSKIFAGYLQGSKDLSNIHEVDAISGAFLFVRRVVGEEIGWWDSDYFFYGEDIQFCYDIKKLGYKIYYIPDVSILHYGGVSSGIKKQSHDISTADMEHRRKMQGHRFEAMRIFFKKNYSGKYPKLINWAVQKGINFMHQKHVGS